MAQTNNNPYDVAECNKILERIAAILAGKDAFIHSIEKKFSAYEEALKKASSFRKHVVEFMEYTDAITESGRIADFTAKLLEEAKEALSNEKVHLAEVKNRKDFLSKKFEVYKHLDLALRKSSVSERSIRFDVCEGAKNVEWESFLDVSTLKLFNEISGEATKRQVDSLHKNVEEIIQTIFFKKIVNKEDSELERVIKEVQHSTNRVNALAISLENLGEVHKELNKLARTVIF